MARARASSGVRGWRERGFSFIFCSTILAKYIYIFGLDKQERIMSRIVYNFKRNGADGQPLRHLDCLRAELKNDPS